MKVIYMKEEFLHFIWEYQRYNSDELFTIDNQTVYVIHPGKHNHHDGPDFLNATLRIGDELWKGSVELHIDGKDWYQHQHHKDSNYSNVILHVVYSNGVTTKNGGGNLIPTLELNGKIPLHLFHKFDQLKANTSVVACSNHIQDIDEFILLAWKERLVAERLESKVADFEYLIERQNGDWEGAFFHILTKNFGLYANLDAFELLAESIDFRILLKHRHNLLELEALLFGQAGMLDRTFKEEYPLALQKEYRYLKKKYKLKSIPASYWRFKQLRPLSFPTVRIAQLANLFHLATPLLTTFHEHEDPLAILRKIGVSDYWKTHFTFEQAATNSKKRIGADFGSTLIINAFIPTIFAMGKATGVPDLCIQAIEYLQVLPPETNRKTNLWKRLDVHCKDAADSQAIIQLVNHYCIPRKCLHCPIGCQILKIDNNEPPRQLQEPEIHYN
jgi:hypothetical protein